MRSAPLTSGKVDRRLFLRSIAACAVATLPLYAPAQQHDSALSEGEVEKLRDAAYDPPSRIQTFIAFLDQRTKEIDRLMAGKRRPGREEDIHDQMSQFADICDELDDNLADYSKRHLDVRKTLPKLVAATERWGTALKSPPDHPDYTVERKLALESLNDVHESATQLIDEQKAWFLAHPPGKDISRPAKTPG